LQKGSDGIDYANEQFKNEGHPQVWDTIPIRLNLMFYSGNVRHAKHLLFWWSILAATTGSVN